MSTSTLVPLSEYLTTSYRPDCDWIEGQLKERNLGEGPHTPVQGIFVGLFRQYRRERQVRVYSEQRVQTSLSHYRIPDVCVVRQDAPFERVYGRPRYCASRSCPGTIG
jgi:Uma2 family endonuclease